MRFRISITCMLLLGIAACSPLPEGTVSQRQAATVTQMEKSGVLPELNRSASLGGTDADHNGIRDDIDTWIAKQPYNEPQRKAAQQLAKSWQADMLTKFKTKKDKRITSEISSKAIHCIFITFNEAEAYKLSKNIGKLTLNTHDRILKQNQNDRLTSGMVFESYYGQNTCE